MKKILVVTALGMMVLPSWGQSSCSGHKKDELDWCSKRNDKTECNKVVEKRMASCLQTGIWEYRGKPALGLTKK